jgi:hypothetical protein
MIFAISLDSLALIKNHAIKAIRGVLTVSHLLDNNALFRRQSLSLSLSSAQNMLWPLNSYDYLVPLSIMLLNSVIGDSIGIDEIDVRQAELVCLNHALYKNIILEYGYKQRAEKRKQSMTRHYWQNVRC